jgi:hypothetical protein
MEGYQRTQMRQFLRQYDVVHGLASAHPHVHVGRTAAGGLGGPQGGASLGLAPVKQGRNREKFCRQERAKSHDYQAKRLTFTRLRVQAQGDLSERARRRALEIAHDADLKTQVPPRWIGDRAC